MTGPEETAEWPPCGARLRDGRPCPRPPLPGRRRCAWHGGAPGSGAPKGNTNARKHGRHDRAAKTRRRLLRDLVRRAEDLLDGLESP